MKTKQYQNIVILTGAGISVPSGLQAFRGNGGLWNNHRVEDIADIAGFRRNPKQVRDFYNCLKLTFQKAVPNPAHLAITKLQRKYNVCVLTQNIDTLHEQAGTENVYHIHGRIDESVCTACCYILKSWENISEETICPVCNKKSFMRPNIVFFGEPIHHTDVIQEVLPAADLLLSGHPARYLRLQLLSTLPENSVPVRWS